MQTVPAVQQWKDRDGRGPGVPGPWVPASRPRVVVAARDAPLLGELAALLSGELAGERARERAGEVARERAGEAGPAAPARFQAPAGPAQPGDIELRLEPLVDAGLTAGQLAEAYRLTAGPVLTITAPAVAGLYYGTRTLLQLLRSGTAPTGTITDWPAFEQRGVMVDVGRKYFSPEWLKRLIENMGWLKLNHLHLHLNDNVGVGLECTSHPEIVSEKHLSYGDLDGILAVAAAHHVTVVPEFDTPSHAAAILARRPELAITDRHGTVEKDKLNVANAAARTLAADVVLEWADRFPGPYFHLGGDEFFAAPWEPAGHQDPLRYPGLAAWARAETGNPGSTAVDGYTLYLNQLSALLRSAGKRARVWNDHVHPGARGVPLDPDVDVECWIRWNAGFPGASDFHRAGHRLVNRNGDHLYFVLSSDSVPPTTGRKSAEGVYELWRPRLFMGAAGGLLDDELDASVPVAGAVMSIWCDYPDALTEAEVADQTLDWFRSLSQQLWGSPKPCGTFAEFSTLFPAVGTAPR
ncbi:hexosaminidase [Arthrobacter silviterrae]|uniref:Family 20 glycosylhydrolase n=1 Tax=Arthrobacter silviterrae TaxID=2026658 RepID=A0ABX0DAU8_9MICC|nr:family 20 glycosylhydrolase [Arthrobacter silviterrae]MDQ0278903.1 hexosaminidase [Arthrobacter silviterrae]NGN84007.1 family 20 glycosylhydrolase [Arthrobacter silviterrae]